MLKCHYEVKCSVIPGIRPPFLLCDEGKSLTISEKWTKQVWCHPLKCQRNRVNLVAIFPAYGRHLVWARWQCLVWVGLSKGFLWQLLSPIIGELVQSPHSTERGSGEPHPQLLLLASQNKKDKLALLKLKYTEFILNKDFNIFSLRNSGVRVSLKPPKQIL